MALSDYAHWNEDAERIWWEEEGRHSDEPDYDPCDYVADDYGDDWFEDEPHDSLDDCQRDGCFSTKDGVHWCCDVCADLGGPGEAFVFLRSEHGEMHVPHVAES